MAIKRPEVSIGAGLATATLVFMIYNRGLPPVADVRQADPSSREAADVDSIRKQNAWLAAGTVAGISLIARDETVFIVGGAMVVALDWMTRHAEWIDPATGSVNIEFSRDEQMDVPTQQMDDSQYGEASNVVNM